MKRLEIDDVRKIGLEKGYILISDNYKNYSTKYDWIDKEGYKYYTSFEKIKNGVIRRYYKSNPYTIDNIRHYLDINNIDYRIVSGEYKSENSKFDWVDSKGYKYYSTFFNIIRGVRPISSHNKYSIENIKHYLKLNDINYTLISDKYISNSEKLIFKCNSNHVFNMTWQDFQDGGRCPYCKFKYRCHDEFVEYIKNVYGNKYTILGEYINSQTKIKVIHNICGTIFYSTPNSLSNGHGCPKNECCKKRGSEHYKWNNDLTDEERKANSSRLTIPGYKQWRYDVLKKYDFKCYICNEPKTTGNKLIPHHLDSWDVSIDKRFDVDNGVCLCEKHHREFHNKYGYGKNTRQQFQKYLSNKTTPR